MKFNWGHGIALFFSCFVGFMVFLAVKSHSVNIDLEAEDYYARELAYQAHMEKKHNAESLSTAPEVRQEGHTLVVTFPEDGVPDTGELLLFRPSDKQYDREVALRPSKGTTRTLNVDGLPGGRYRLQLDWERAGVAYFTELSVYLR
ncbi:FixH family protein [Roseivirga sp. BDSF3-8]|uniref:FixH family protein n=1 Tax=Roseivirga sp. BDSF3-8 TaxID=3241598 RepID=UPI0035322CD3